MAELSTAPRGFDQTGRFESKKYWAFISYSQRDRKWGEWLIRSLETYRVPKPLVGKQTPGGVVPARLTPIFRDRDELSGAADLGEKIREAIDQSRVLIIICSPNAARSEWVNKEVVTFKCSGRGSRILTLIVDGEPNAADANLECFPLAVRYRVDASGVITGEAAEPLAADARDDGDGKRNALLKLIAGVLSVDYDALRQRDHERRIRRFWVGGAILSSLALLFLVLAIYANQQRIYANERAQVALSRQYAAEAMGSIKDRLDEAIVLSAKALSTAATTEAVNAVYEAAVFNPGIRAFLHRLGDRERPAISLDTSGKHVALAVGDKVNLFELESAVQLKSQTIELSTASIRDIAYSHDSSHFAIGRADGQVSVVRTSQWQMVGSPIVVSGEPIDRIFFSKSGDQIYAISGTAWTRLQISNSGLTPVESGRLAELSSPDWKRYFATAISADGRTLVTGLGTEVIAWDVNEGLRQRYSFDARGKIRYTIVIRELSISPDGKTVAVDFLPGSDGIGDNYVQLYALDQLAPNRELATLRTPKYVASTEISRLAFSNKGDVLVAGNSNGTFQQLSLPTDGQPSSPRDTKVIHVSGFTGEGWLHEPHFATDDRSLVLAAGRQVVLWDRDRYQESRLVHKSASQNGTPRGISFLKNNDLILTTSDGFTHRWNVLDGGSQESKQVARDSDSSAVFGFTHRLGMRLAVMQQDRLSFVETLTGVHQGGLPLEGWTPLAVSPDGGSVVVFKSGILRVLSTAGPHEIWRKELYDQNQLANPPLRDPGIAFSDNGARIFVHVYGTGAVTKWDAISGQQTDSFQTGSERAWTWDANGDPVISANGEWIASAADNRSLRVINTATREALLIHDFPGSVCGVAFSPDGAKLAIAYDREKTAVEDSSDGRSHPAQYGVRFWDLETRRWLEQSVEGLPDPPCHLAFSQDGARMAIATSSEHDDEPSQVFLFDFAPSLWAKAALGRLRFKSEAIDLPVQPGGGARH